VSFVKFLAFFQTTSGINISSIMQLQFVFCKVVSGILTRGGV